MRGGNETGSKSGALAQLSPFQAAGSNEQSLEASSSLLGAIESGDRLCVERVLSKLSLGERREELMKRCTIACETGFSPPRSMPPIFHAAYSGNVDVFLAVCRAITDSLAQEVVVDMITSARDDGGRNMLATALESGEVNIVHAFVEFVDECSAKSHQKMQMLSSVNDKGQTALMVAVQTKKMEIVGAVAKLIGETWVPVDEGAVIVTAIDSRGWTALTFAVGSRRAECVDAVVAIIERVGPPKQINPIIEDCLPCAIFEFLESSSKLGKENSLDVIASLLKHGIWPTPRQLSLIGSNAGFESSKKCLLDAISLATNPVLVGMTLSLQLSGSAGLGNEAHRQTASRLQNAVEELLLEIFERLPQTVDGFEEVEPIRGGMKACSIIFAPEKIQDCDNSFQPHESDKEHSRIMMGPLEIALQGRHLLELFCTQPLVLDFMSRKFTCGLPGHWATERGMREADEVQRYQQEHMSVQQESRGTLRGIAKEMLAVLDGTHATLGSLTHLPGAQFILTQLVTRPAFSYSVPAVRMAMALFIYLMMLALFSSHVLLYQGAVGAGEIVFFFYVLGAILIEVFELWEGKEEYMKDHWNILDVLALAFCGAAFLVRISDPDSLWGRALYGAGTPLLLCRILFFAQFLPAQGPMIEVIFSLTGELARFGTIMVVVMAGFAMSFFALFRHSCTVSAFRTYSETSISLLRAMLGETQLFDTFDVAVECCNSMKETSDELHCEDFLMECCHNARNEHFNGLVGKALLVAYLTLMGIILLNLLIAVLSEAYVDVKENIETESKVSRALVIQHYMEAVEDDMLPSPLNLIQYAIALLAMGVGYCGGKQGYDYFKRAEYFAGLALFWVFSGFLALSAGSILWLISWPKTLITLSRRCLSAEEARIPITIQVPVLLCGVTMPFFLVCHWLWASTCGALWRHVFYVWSHTEPGYSEISGTSRKDDGIVGKALKHAPGSLSVQQLREYLANPMNDPVVQRDEESRATTVEHIKLLRDRLENLVEEKVGKLGVTTAASFEGLESKIEGIVVDQTRVLSERVDDIDKKLADILGVLKKLKS